MSEPDELQAWAERVGYDPIPDVVANATTDPKPVESSTPRTPRAPARRGRPKGAKTDPRIKAATAARKGQPLADAAAEAAATALERETRKAGRPSVDAKESAKLQQGLQSFYVGAGAMVAVLGGVLGNPRMVAGGNACVAQGAECATALVAWSETNSAVRKALESLTVAGGASLVIAAHAPIAAAIWNPEASTDPEASGVGSVETAQGFDLGTLVGLFT